MIILQEPISNRFDVNNKIYKKLNKTNLIIAGGAARQIYLNDGFGSTDIDLYFESGLKRAVYEKWLNVFATRGDRKGYNSSNAFNYTREGIKYQVIHRVGTIEEIFSTYDFHCCCFAVKDNIIYYTPEAKEDADNKQLRVTNYKAYKAFDWPANRDHPIEVRRSIPPYNNRVVKYALTKGYIPADDTVWEILDSIIKQCIKELTKYPQDKEYLLNLMFGLDTDITREGVVVGHLPNVGQGVDPFVFDDILEEDLLNAEPGALINVHPGVGP